MERKKELRKWIRQEKALYSTSTLKELSVNILTHLEKLPAFQDAHNILIYHSISDEVYTHEFINKWVQTKRVILPVVVGDVLELRHYTGPQDLIISSYGIAEPTGQPFTDYSSIDLAIIPGMAFDRQGHRLGRGKGYYDKLLPHISAPKVGICFSFQIVEEVPTDQLDINMDLIIANNENELSHPHHPLPSCNWE